MPNYDDMSVGPSFTPLPVDEADTVIYCESGAIRFTTHTNPQGNTAGIPLKQGEAFAVKGGTELRVKTAISVPSVIVRSGS